MGTLAPESPDHSGGEASEGSEAVGKGPLMSFDVFGPSVLLVFETASYLRTYTMLGDAAGSGRGAAAGVLTLDQ